MFFKRLSLARLLSTFLLRFFLSALLQFFFYFTSPAILPLDFQTLHLVKSNIFSMKTLVFFFAGITDLMRPIWLLHMAGRQALFFTTLFFISFVIREIASQQCHGIYSIHQMMLKGHTYKTFKTTPGTPECRDICLADERCQSFNVVMFIAICELNNRTKEARPEDFVKDEYRYYMAKGPKRGNRTCKNKIAGCLRLWILHY